MLPKSGSERFEPSTLIPHGPGSPKSGALPVPGGGVPPPAECRRTRPVASPAPGGGGGESGGSGAGAEIGAGGNVTL